MEKNPTGMNVARRVAHPILIIAFILSVITFGSAVEADEPILYAIHAPLASRSLMLDVTDVGDRLVAVGERGHILLSDDNGATWRQVDVPTRAMLTAVAFVDESTGVAVGHDSVIVRTTDAGETWERVHWAPEDEAPFFDVWFADRNSGVALGAYGSHFVTADAGLTWSFESLADTDWHLHEIARAVDGKLFVAAEAGFIYRSDDGGNTWIELPSPYEGSFFGVLPLADDSVLLFGLRGHLFRSDDSGETWTKVETDTVAMLNKGIVLADGSIVIVGLGGTVLVSTDGGFSFDRFQQAGRRGISSVVEHDGSLTLVGEFGVRTATLAELESTSEEGDGQ